jgi:hypothetical protein
MQYIKDKLRLLLSAQKDSRVLICAREDVLRYLWYLEGRSTAYGDDGPNMPRVEVEPLRYMGRPLCIEAGVAHVVTAEALSEFKAEHKNKEPKGLFCSFCGADPTNCKQLVSSEDSRTCICSRCAWQTVRILAMDAVGITDDAIRKLKGQREVGAAITAMQQTGPVARSSRDASEDG